MLVVDLADDLLDNVFDRHQTVGAAIFVDHQSEVNARGLHLRQQIDGAHRRRHIQQFAHDVGVEQRLRQIDLAQIETGGRQLLALAVRHQLDLGFRGHIGQQVADMHHADRVIEGLVIDH